MAELNETPYMDSIIRCRADKGSTVVVRSEAAAVPMVPNNPKKVKKVTVRDPDAPRVADELRVFCTNLSFDTTNEVHTTISISDICNLYFIVALGSERSFRWCRTHCLCCCQYD